MESGYDENLEENTFFKTLKNDFDSIFHNAVAESWTICVPCSESIEQYEVNQDNIFTHVLIPCDELPGIQFRSLNGEDVKIHEKFVKLRNFPNIPVLFSEVFYVDELRYEVLCLESPLNFNLQSKKFNPRLYSVRTLQDCVSLLSEECSNKWVIGKIDEIIKQFLFLTSKNYFSRTLNQQVEFVNGIYNRCLEVVTSDKRMNDRMRENRVFTENVQIAVESYVLHNMYPIIMKGLITNTTCEIGQFNKTLRNLSNIQLQHLKVLDTLFDSILKARAELSHLNVYSTVLGKLSCLKRCINLLSDQRSDKLSVDELLPILVFLVVKSGITTWVAQLKYVKQFSFSRKNYNHANESGFLVTTLEAIITFIQSGLFYKSIYSNEFDLIKMSDSESDVCTYICGKSKLFWKTKHPLLLKVFQFIYNDDLKEVSSLFSVQNESNDTPEFQYCHPLCSCDRCEKLFTSSRQAANLNLNSVNESGYSPLHVAACYGKCSIVDWLLNNGARPNCTDFFGSTPLHCAAQHGYQNTLLLLIYKQAKLDATDDDGNTPLHLASVNGHTDCVKALVYFAEQANIRLDVNVANKDGDTALHLAVKYYHIDISKILLNYNADTSLKNKHNVSAFEMTESLRIKGILNEKYDSVNLLSFAAKIPVAKNDRVIINKFRMSKDEFGTQPLTAEGIKNLDRLFKATKDNDVKTMKKYLGFSGFELVQGSVEMKKSNYKCHPLCRCDKCFVEVSANDSDDAFSRINATSANICDSDGFTALHIACKYGRVEAINFLLELGANINVRTYQQFLTPLHIVCIQNQFCTAKILLQCSSCKVDLQDRNGNTALHYACMAGNVRIVELILKNQPNLEIRNDRGKTAMNEAEENLSYSVMRTIQSSKPDPNEELLW